MRINVKEARNQFSEMLNRVEEGDEVVILRRGKVVAKLVSFHEEGKTLPSLKTFRQTLQTTTSLSQAVIENREKERY